MRTSLTPSTSLTVKTSPTRRLCAGAAVTVLAGLATVAVAAEPSSAAPAPVATGVALRVALDAKAGAPIGVVANANATVSSAQAPPNSSVSAVNVATALSGLVGVSATNGTASASATTSATRNRGTSRIDGLNALVLGAPINATVLSATATCPTSGAATAATTTVTALTVFGDAITATVNGPTVRSSTAVTVAGITAARLHAAIRTRIETVTANTASATALQITFSLTGSTSAGEPVDLALGTVTAGVATCERPSAAAPTETGLTPKSGPTAGGTTVTVTGSGFVDGATTVKIGGITIPAADVDVVSPTKLRFTAPAHAAGPVAVTTTTAAGTSAGQTYTYIPSASPTETGLTPKSGPTAGGTTVTVTGSGFVDGATTVKIGGVTIPAADVDVTSPTKLTFKTPAHTAGPVAVTTTTAGGTSDRQTYTYVASAAPTETGLTAKSGPTAGGTTVTVTGSGFVDGATTVNIGGVTIPAADVDVVSPTKLRFTAPAHAAGPVAVTTTTAGGTSSPRTFTYRRPPTSTAINPGSGPTTGGTTVTLTGLGFVSGATRIAIGGLIISPDDVNVHGSTSLSFTAPAQAQGTVQVTATTPGGTSDPQTFTYAAGTPAGSSGGGSSGGSSDGSSGGGSTSGTSSGASTTGSDLANTGTPVRLPLMVGLLSLVGGGLLLRLGRRRTAGSASVRAV